MFLFIDDYGSGPIQKRIKIVTSMHREGAHAQSFASCESRRLEVNSWF